MVQTVSAIVCAYNEEKTIKPIVEVLLNHPRISEVIAVDDGSTDRTWQILDEIHHPSLAVIRHPKNRGKGAAVTSAVKKSSKDVLLFVDADLRGFRGNHIDLLLIPLEIEPRCMTIGLREPYNSLDKTIQLLMKSLGGERAIRKAVIVPLLKRIRRAGYGVEMILNVQFIKQGHPIYFIPLPKLVHPIKTAKRTISGVLKEYWREQNDILRQLLGLDTLPSLQDILNKLQLH